METNDVNLKVPKPTVDKRPVVYIQSPENTSIETLMRQDQYLQTKAPTVNHIVLLPGFHPVSKPPLRPAVILASLMWALFTILGVCMTLGLLPATWFGGGFVFICFLVAVMVSMSVAGSEKK